MSDKPKRVRWTTLEDFSGSKIRQPRKEQAPGLRLELRKPPLKDGEETQDVPSEPNGKTKDPEPAPTMTLEQRIQRLEDMFEALARVLSVKISMNHDVTIALYDYLHSRHPRATEDFMIRKMDERAREFDDPATYKKIFADLGDEMLKVLKHMKQECDCK